MAQVSYELKALMLHQAPCYVAMMRLWYCYGVAGVLWCCIRPGRPACIWCYTQGPQATGAMFHPQP